MNPPLSRRDVIAAQVLATVIATIEPVPRDAARTTIEYTDTLIDELDRTAPKDETPKPEAKDPGMAWVIRRDPDIEGIEWRLSREVRREIEELGLTVTKVRLVPVEEPTP